MPLLTSRVPRDPRALNRLVVGAFLVASVTLLVVGQLSLRSLSDMRDEAEARNVASQRVVRLGALLANLLNAETGERGYLLTDSASFLEPFQLALSDLAADTLELNRLAGGDSALAPDLAQLSALIPVQLAGLDSAIRLQQAGKASSVRLLLLAHSNKRIMDQIRQVIGRVESTLNSERALRTSQVTSAADRTRTIVWITSLMTVLILGGAVLLIQRSVNAQAQSEAGARSAEARLRAILEQMPLGVVVIDPSGAPQFANKAAKAILGRDMGPGMNLADHPQIYQVYRAGTNEIFPADELPISRALHGESAYDSGLDIRAPDRTVPVEVWAAPVHDESGKVALAIAAFGDITERMESEKRLKDSERRLQEILDSIPLGITVADRDGKPTFLNKAGIRLLGRDLLVDVPNARLSEHYQLYRAGTSEPYPAELRGITRALRGEFVYADDLEIQTPERRIPLEIWSAPVYDSDGTLAMAISAYGDITDRVEAERQIKDSEQRLKKILDSIPLGISVADERGTVTFLNTAGKKLLGRDLIAGLENGKLSETYQVYVRGTDELYPAERRGLNRALKGEQSYMDDLEFRGPERRVPIEIWSAPVYDDAGRMIMAISAYGDISARLEAHQKIEALTTRLQVQVEELASVNKELESFSYSVAHDLRAPLRAISGFSGMVLEDYAAALDKEGLRLLGVVRDNAIRMGALIDDLLAFSRLSRQRMSPREVDMAALVATVIDDLMQSLPEGTVRPIVEPLPKAIGDATLLRQVWANLIGNALKYSRKTEHPRVEVGSIWTPAERSGVVYFVRDNGVGFDMSHANKLFGVFQRLHRVDEFEGTGVGLAIVHRVITRHGGRIWAESSVGQGATFYFTMPPDGTHQ